MHAADPPRDYGVASATLRGNGYVLVENASLGRRNTFGVPARANMLVDVHKAAALAELFDYPLLKSQPLLVLGTGSNVLLTRDWPGIVVSIVERGISVLDDDGAHARVRVAAGENWNDFVHWSLGRGFAGLENLVLIPGTVGAAPIQNIGAYGVEVGEFVTAVDAWDRLDNRRVHLDHAACAFGYRDSLFKSQRDRYLVVAVEFLLPRERALRLDYAGVREELTALGTAKPTPATTAEAISRIRMRKLPDPAVIGNAGSFFKNPLIDPALAQRLRTDEPALPQWPAADGMVKLSAAWMIEACGLRGVREGDAGIAAQHALVLVNHGHATGAELWTLAAHVRVAVHERFGVTLEPEPLIV